MIENQDFERYLKTLHEHLCCNMTEEQRKKEYFACYVSFPLRGKFLTHIFRVTEFLSDIFSAIRKFCKFIFLFR